MRASKDGKSSLEIIERNVIIIFCESSESFHSRRLLRFDVIKYTNESDSMFSRLAGAAYEAGKLEKASSASPCVRSSLTKECREIIQEWNKLKNAIKDEIENKVNFEFQGIVDDVEKIKWFEDFFVRLFCVLQFVRVGDGAGEMMVKNCFVHLMFT